MQQGLRGDPRETGTVPASRSVAFWSTPVLGPQNSQLGVRNKVKWLLLTEPASPVREGLNLESTHTLSPCRVCCFPERSQGIRPAYTGALVKLLENSHQLDLLCIQKYEWKQNRWVSTCNLHITPNISRERSLCPARPEVGFTSPSQPGEGSEGGNRRLFSPH